MSKNDRQERPPGNESAREPVVKSDARISGRVDAIEGGRLFGWVWNADKPSDRLTVTILVDQKPVATAVADRPRVDLRRNGIGDGAHAFDFELPNEARSQTAHLEVFAVTSDGERHALRVPTDKERAAEAAIAVPLSRILEKLDILAAAHRQLQLGQRDVAVTLSSAADDLGKIGAEGGVLAQTVEIVRRGQEELSSRVKEIEIFLLRFDRTLGGFEANLRKLQSPQEHHLRPLLLTFSVLAGTIAGALLTFIAR